MILQTTGALPTGLSVNTVYFVKFIDANTFNLSATQGGAPMPVARAASSIFLCVSNAVVLNVARVNAPFFQARPQVPCPAAFRRRCKTLFQTAQPLGNRPHGSILGGGVTGPWHIRILVRSVPLRRLGQFRCLLQCREPDFNVLGFQSLLPALQYAVCGAQAPPDMEKLTTLAAHYSRAASKLISSIRLQ